MKYALKPLIGVATFLAILAGAAMTYSTAEGYTVWYFVVPTAGISVNGKPSSGWVHKMQNGLEILVTRNDSERRETYAVLLTTGDVRQRCPTAPRIPIFAEGDLIPPGCIGIDNGSSISLRHPPDRKLTITSKSVVFLADDGKRIEAHW